MDHNPLQPAASSHVWLAATIAEGQIVFHRPAQPGPHEPGTLREQLQVAELAAENPWHYADRGAAMRAARRTILRHARRAKR